MRGNQSDIIQYFHPAHCKRHHLLPKVRVRPPVCITTSPPFNSVLFHLIRTKSINESMLSRTASLATRQIFKTARRLVQTPPSIKSYTTSRTLLAKDSKMSSEPPKHAMAYFPKLTSEKRAFGQFRKVIHTGLYSQLVTMEIPIGGEIGDEVIIVHDLNHPYHRVLILSRCTRSTKC